MGMWTPAIGDGSWSLGQMDLRGIPTHLVVTKTKVFGSFHSSFPQMLHTVVGLFLNWVMGSIGSVGMAFFPLRHIFLVNPERLSV